jgi:hypothetical protein
MAVRALGPGDDREHYLVLELRIFDCRRIAARRPVPAHAALGPHSPHTLVRFLILQTDFVDEFRIELEFLRQLRSPGLRVYLRVIGRDFEFEGSVIRPSSSLSECGGSAQRTAAHVGRQIVAETRRLNYERVAWPVGSGVAGPAGILILRLKQSAGRPSSATAWRTFILS